MTEHTVSVGELSGFCHRSGDIDYRFGPSPTGEEGVEGHQKLYRRRPEGYQPERSVEAGHSIEGVQLLVRGRADGWQENASLVEEIKTCRVDPARIPAAVTRMHLAQGQLYAAMIAQELDLAAVTVRLTWYFLDEDQEHPLEQHYERRELDAFLQQTLQTYAQWLQKWQASRDARNASLASLPFPHGEFRPGQRDMAELVFKCADQAGQLLLEAPTGIGKTMAVLYPALRAIGSDKHDALLFCTAKTAGRRAAEQAVARLRESGLHAVSLTLTARERICFSPGKACRGDECPFAHDFYSRLPAAREEALANANLTRETIEAIAERHRVCPYYLSVEMARWCDIIICDFHYVFSLTATLSALPDSGAARWSVLIDEAHNLPGRARSMFGATLAKRDLMAARRQAPPALKKKLNRLNKLLLSLQSDNWQEPDYACRAELPDGLATELSGFTGAFTDALVSDPGLSARAPELLDFYFQCLQFLRVCECWGDEYRLELTRGASKQSLKLRLNCLDPARLLADKLSSWHSVVAFSATLSPLPWMRRSMGLSEQAVATQLASPFAQSQMQVRIVSNLDTRWRQREATLPALAAVISEWLARVPGNCLVFFPSYRYMRDCLALLAPADRLPARSLWVQTADQAPAEREALLAELERHTDIAAFCILGGVLGEGIDLPGDQLTSVVVVGVGMPQVDREARLLQAYNEQHYGAGFDYSFRFPGVQKVNQAIGRVIRTATDEGQALLIDPRYGEPGYRKLLAPWWDYSEMAPSGEGDEYPSGSRQ